MNNGGTMRISRRGFAIGGLAVFAAACSLPTATEDESQPPPTGGGYEFQTTATTGMTVAQALKASGLRLGFENPGHPALITQINGIAAGPGEGWRIDVNHGWFGDDAVSKNVLAGDVIGCFRGK
jgi:hypothetical protein